MCNHLESDLLNVKFVKLITICSFLFNHPEIRFINTIEFSLTKTRFVSKTIKTAITLLNN